MIGEEGRQRQAWWQEPVVQAAQPRQQAKVVKHAGPAGQREVVVQPGHHGVLEDRVLGRDPDALVGPAQLGVQRLQRVADGADRAEPFLRPAAVREPGQLRPQPLQQFTDRVHASPGAARQRGGQPAEMVQ